MAAYRPPLDRQIHGQHKGDALALLKRNWKHLGALWVLVTVVLTLVGTIAYTAGLEAGRQLYPPCTAQHTDGPVILDDFVGPPDPSTVTSKLASTREGGTKWCSTYLQQMADIPYRRHRKQWEFCWIARVVDHFGKLGPGHKGLGFAVGIEPLASFFVKWGVEVVVTDMPKSSKGYTGWASTDQHSAGLNATWKAGVVDWALYHQKARFRPVDMNKLPSDLLQEGFDFVWSSSSLEHVGPGQGGVEMGTRFILDAMGALKVGGVAVHTTELLLSSLDAVHERPGFAVWRKQDVDRLAERLSREGYRLLPVDWHSGEGPSELEVDSLPYQPSNHYKLRVANIIHTSIGLVIVRTQ